MTSTQNSSDIREILEFYHDKFNNPDFIENDPISIPHSFTDKEDIEISGFLAATIAWGNRKAIIKSSRQMLRLMDNSPADFLKNAEDKDFEQLKSFVYRTFNGEDLYDICLCLQHFLNTHKSLGNFFETEYSKSCDLRMTISEFRKQMLEAPHSAHMEKHISNIDKGAACKRLFMYLRWMVRCDKRGVDFGLWQNIPMSALYIPLDVHSSKTARELHLLKRKQNDIKAVEELTLNLRAFDSHDPARFDFALFGAGVNNVRL